MSWKTSLLVGSEILGLFINTLTANDKNYRHNRENFPEPNQIQLSKKSKTSQIFSALPKSGSNFVHFEKKDAPLSLIISEINDSEIHC